MAFRQRVVVNYPISQAPIVKSIIQTEDDPPVTLHMLFVPETREYTPEEVWDASQLEPFDRLPWLFLQTTLHSPPFQPGDLEPPVFHYGWRPNVERLVAYARARQLVVSYGDPSRSSKHHISNILRPEAPLIYDVSVDPVSGMEVMVPKAETEALWPTAPAPEPSDIDLFATMERALPEMTAGLVRDGMLGAWCERVSLALTLRADEGRNYIVSVIRNSQLTVEGGELPTPEEMAQLAEVLGVSGPPRWYVDRDALIWNDLFEDSHS
ncbi:hypothetical protein FOMPIDRAFT_1015466 [Fomitopsis schrenkii]|uniref:Uncharacterized protein n=1 Tax=Fomitopsis schrenkii TaxID=2126942 RepID=S8EBW5_FOMSC|nr:hypothetical protein FOMPIDRAFT_1015466 [Fomitopsis schrenkii]